MLVAYDRRFVDVVAIDVHDVGRMLNNLLGEIRVRPFVHYFPRVGARVEDLHSGKYVMYTIVVEYVFFFFKRCPILYNCQPAILV